MEEMLVRLKSAAAGRPGRECETYRHHAEVVVRAREVFERCPRRDAIASATSPQMDGALDDVTSVIDSGVQSRGNRFPAPRTPPEPEQRRGIARLNCIFRVKIWLGIRLTDAEIEVVCPRWRLSHDPHRPPGCRRGASGSCARM